MRLARPDLLVQECLLGLAITAGAACGGGGDSPTTSQSSTSTGTGTGADTGDTTVPTTGDTSTAASTGEPLTCAPQPVVPPGTGFFTDISDASDK